MPTNSVGVLTFENATRDSADAYLAEGLADQIATRLVQVPRLLVTSRTTMRRIRSATLDARAIGRAARVTWLVTGTIRRSRTRIRVNAQLERTSDGVQVWARSFDADDPDFLAIEETIATAVAEAIAGYLRPEERRMLAARPTSNRVAHDHLLRANYLLQRRSLSTLPVAGREYEEALRLDPGLSEAEAGLAMVYYHIASRGGMYRGFTADSLSALARAAAQRAVAAAPASAVAWSARGGSLAFTTDSVVEAQRALDRAIALDPESAETIHILGWALLLAWRDSAAAATFHRALAVEPDRPVSLLGLYFVAAATQQWDTAARWLDSAITLDPSYGPAFRDRADFRLSRGDTAGVAADIETARSLGESTELTAAVLALARGDSAGLLRLLASPGVCAGAAAYLGRAREAFDCVGRTGASIAWTLWRFRYHPYTRLVEDPRYQVLLADGRRRGIIAR